MINACVPLLACKQCNLSDFHDTASCEAAAHKLRKGFSLLEVILALAILTGAIAVLGELGRLGFHNARLTQDLTRAQLLCESKMAEFTSGVTTPQTTQSTPFDSIDQDSSIQWVYSVEMDEIDQDGLIALRVTVSQDLPAVQRPATFTLVRWIPDPSLTQSSSSTQQSSASTSATGSSNAQ